MLKTKSQCNKNSYFFYFNETAINPKRSPAVFEIYELLPPQMFRGPGKDRTGQDRTGQDRTQFGNLFEEIVFFYNNRIVF